MQMSFSVPKCQQTSLLELFVLIMPVYISRRLYDGASSRVAEVIRAVRASAESSWARIKSGEGIRESIIDACLFILLAFPMIHKIN